MTIRHGWLYYRTIQMGNFKGQETVTEKGSFRSSMTEMGFVFFFLPDLLMHCKMEEAEIPNGFLDLKGHLIP